MKAGRLVSAILLLITASVHVGAGQTQAQPDMYTVSEARAILDYNQKKHPGDDWSFETFAKHRLELPAEKLRPNDRFGKELLDDYVPPIPVEEAEPGIHFLGPKIRSSFSDVLSSEDPTASGDPDLKGASFSYQHDFQAGSDAWGAKGAVILPFTGATTFKPHLGDPPGLHTYGFVPSISFDRETNGADATKDIDSLIFRAGLFAKYTSGTWLRAQTIRVFGTYGTDFGFKSETPAAEFEYEPVVFFQGSRFGIGSTYSLHEVNDSGSPTGKRTNLAYIFRAYLHGEYGQTTDPGDKVGVSDQDFFRVGPRCEFRLDPLFSERLALSVSYEYLASVIGETAHNHHLRVESEYRITTAREQKKNPLLPVISLKVTYEEGGIDLTREDVQTFLVGLGVTL